MVEENTQNDESSKELEKIHQDFKKMEEELYQKLKNVVKKSLLEKFQRELDQEL